MPMPNAYQHAGEAFDRLLLDVRDRADLATRNQAYTVLEAVLRVFARRLSAEEVLRFAAVLPPVARALFVEQWRAGETAMFAPRATLAEEVAAVRAHHNFADAGAITAVAAAVRAVVDGAAFEAVLATLPVGAVAFWAL